MARDFGCRHSDKLQSFFNIEARGIDYINNQGISFEFKESHAKDLSQLFFKVPYNQLDQTNYIVFCVQDKEFFIHSSEMFLIGYKFEGKYEHCCLRYNTISRNYIEMFETLEELKECIENWGWK